MDLTPVKLRDLENSDQLQFGPVVSLENSDYLLENSANYAGEFGLLTNLCFIKYINRL